jgi:hypothetical protein
MDEEQERVTKRLRRAVKACQDAGLLLVADLDVMGVRVLTREQYDSTDDLRTTDDAEIIEFDSACGGEKGDSCSFMTVPMGTHAPLY